MLTSHELSRIRRQAHRRLKVILAQRRLAAPHRRAAPLGDPPKPPDHPSPEPAPKH